MIPYTPAKLTIWQQSACKSKIDTNYIINQASPTKYNIILIQEPWFDHLRKMRGTHDWRIIYPPTIYQDNHQCIHSIILINTNISTNAYTPLDIPCSNITAIRLKGEFGNCSIFNIYNDCTNNSTTTTLQTYLDEHPHEVLPSPNDHMPWFGDFNWHLFNLAKMISPLLDLISNHDMTTVLPPGIPTYKTVTSNWTHPNNVWCRINDTNIITICDVNPSIRPPHADHLPIYTEIDLQIQRTNSPPSWNLRTANFKAINEWLVLLLNTHCPAKEIQTKNEFEETVNNLTQIIQEVIEQVVPASKPCPYMKRWWTKELTKLKKSTNKLSKCLYRFRGTPDHPAHAEYKSTANKLSKSIEEPKKNHWSDWLKNATSNDVYTTNKYINSDPSDYLNAHIPNLKIQDTMTRQETLAMENTAKPTALANSFFPLLPTTPIIPDTVYPKPLKAWGTFTRHDIRSAIRKLKPYKAPGIDGIQNILLKECAEALINNLYYIYKAVINLDVYPSCWLVILTVVLQKAGKTAYNIAKSYHPIGLLNTLGKLLSTLVAADISYLTEKHLLLLPTQFGGHPGRCTTNVMHLVTQQIKDAWRSKKTASILFLNIQAAFPNTVKERLIHNMKTRQVPTRYNKLIDRMLSNCSTRLKFNDFISKLININNRTTQGCLLSMLLHAFYNTDLIDITNGKNELSTGFVDNCAFIAIGDMLEEMHQTLQNMMERPSSRLEWAHSHNSTFELLKLAVMDFPHPNTNTPTTPLIITTPHTNGTSTTSSIACVQEYKYLGVIFDPKLTWKTHFTKVTAPTTHWSQQLWRISKAARGLSPSKTHQLYITIAIPAITYASDIWYIPPYKTAHSQKHSGSVKETKELQLIQGTMTRFITGGIRGTAFNILEIHTNIPPIDLLIRKIQAKAALHICALPPNHPLHSLACRTSTHFICSHKSPLHYLFFTTGFKPTPIKTISATRHRPTYLPTMRTIISFDKEDTLIFTNIAHNNMKYKVYCDGSGFKGGIGAAAVLYDNNWIIKTLQLHLGAATKHTVYESELTGILLTLHLLLLLTKQITNTIIIGLDNQAAIWSLYNQNPRPSHYLIDQIHSVAEHLHSHQDRIQWCRELQWARCAGQHPHIRTSGVCNLQIHWVPGHLNFEPKEKVDKLATKGESSTQADLPAFLCKTLSTSLIALHQETNCKTQCKWKRCWKESPWYGHLGSIDISTPSKIWLNLVKPLTRKQASILMQLRSGHISLNKHLHKIWSSNTPNCPNCNKNTPETIHHFLFECTNYYHEQAILHRTLQRKSHELSYLLSNPTTTLPLLKFIHTTGQLKQTFGPITTDA